MSLKKSKSVVQSDETDIYPPEKRSLIMSKVRSAGTKPELAVREVLRSLGVKYRANRKDLPGKPDLVIAKNRVAIFVHGCFWHGHDCPKGTKLPKKNLEFWINKIEQTKIRDKRRIESLAECNWTTVVIWECETRNRTSLIQSLSSLSA